jgi:hypothetical protein
MIKYLFFLFSVFVYSQSISKQVIGAAGATQTNSNLRVSFTVGEPVVGIMTAEGIQLGNGYYPALDMQTLSIEQPELELSFMLYPNPTSQALYVTHPTLPSFHLQMVDVNGKQVFSGFINNNEPLDVTKFAQGIYVVVIENPENNKKNTYKIIKK